MKFKFKPYLYTLLMLWFSLACHAENKITNLLISENQDSVTITPELEFTTSKEIKDAIDNGIRVQLIVKANLFEPVSWWFDNSISSEYLQLEISYFLLGEYYVIKDKKTDQSIISNNEYNKLWDQLNKSISIKLPKLNSKDPWIKMRIMLDKGSLPTAMQLPVLFDDNWDIDTQWYAQQVKLSE